MPNAWQIAMLTKSTSRSGRTEVFCKKGDLKNFAKFTGKHLCQSLFFNKVASLKLQDSGTGVFP